MNQSWRRRGKRVQVCWSKHWTAKYNLDDPRNFIKSIECIDMKRFGEDRELNGIEMTEYRAMVCRVNWLAQHTRPEISLKSI